MKFSIGDQILLKRTGEEGRVVAFLSKAMMEVEVAGVRFPVYNEDVDHPYLRWFTEKKKPVAAKSTADIPVEQATKRPQRLARGIYLSFLPQLAAGEMEDIIESFRIHFINETPDAIAFTYHVRNASGASLFQHKATLHPFGHVYLHPVSLEAVNGQPRFHWEILPITAKNGAPPVRGTLRIRPAQLVRFITTMLEENNPAFSILLAQDAEQTAPLPVPMVPFPAREAAPNVPQPRIVLHTVPDAILDLHLTALGTYTGDLSPEAILHAQLSLLEQKLQAALATGMGRMIVIHGLGKGTLRQKVHEVFTATPGVISFSNRWMGNYGWGATEVIFDTR